MSENKEVLFIKDRKPGYIADLEKLDQLRELKELGIVDLILFYPFTHSSPSNKKLLFQMQYAAVKYKDNSTRDPSNVNYVIYLMFDSNKQDYCFMYAPVIDSVNDNCTNVIAPTINELFMLLINAENLQEDALKDLENLVLSKMDDDKSLSSIFTSICRYCEEKIPSISISCGRRTSTETHATLRNFQISTTDVRSKHPSARLIVSALLVRINELILDSPYLNEISKRAKDYFNKKNITFESFLKEPNN